MMQSASSGGGGGGGGSFLDTLSSSESIFNVSSSSSAPRTQGDGGGGSSHGFPPSSSSGGSVSAADSGYLPPPPMTSSQQPSLPGAGGDSPLPPLDTAEDGGFPLLVATTGDDVTTPADSGYFPPPMTLNFNLEPSPSVPPANVTSSSSGSSGFFPGQSPGMAMMGGVGLSSSADEVDLDDFDLPPLPDSMGPTEGGVAGYGDVGRYGGSIVTFLGTPRTQN